MTPLSSYRRTGADPPFGDPRRAHGTRFEGYYWRLTDVAAGRVAIVLCGVCRDAAGPWAIVALAASDGLVRSPDRAASAEVSFGGLGSPRRDRPLRLGRGVARRPRAGCASSNCALRKGSSGRGGCSGGSGRRRSCRGCRSTGIRTCSARASWVRGGTARRRTRRRTGGRASPSTGGGGRPRASRAPTPASRSPAAGCWAARRLRWWCGSRTGCCGWRRRSRGVVTAVGEAGWRVRARSAAVDGRAGGRGGGSAGRAAGPGAGGAPRRRPLAAVPGGDACRVRVWRGRRLWWSGSFWARRTRAVDLGSRRTAAG